MTETAILVAGAIFITGLIAEFIAVMTAPVGYQDERGFHMGDQVSGTATDGRWENPS